MSAKEHLNTIGRGLISVGLMMLFRIDFTKSDPGTAIFLIMVGILIALAMRDKI